MAEHAAVVELPGEVVMPGLIETGTHAPFAAGGVPGEREFKDFAVR